MVKKEGCLRTAKDVVPLAISSWNYLKGGVDITSRYLKDCQAEMEGYCTPTQRLYLKIIKMYLLNAFRIYCAAMTFEDLAEGHITSWKELRRSMNRRTTFQDFVNEASEVLGDFMLPGGETVWRNMNSADAEGPTYCSSDSGKSDDNNSIPKKIAKKRDRKVMKYRHRQDWVNDVKKQRCRLSKFWRKMGADQDDGHLHSHAKEMVKSASFRCVLCCRICFDPTELCMTVTLITTQNWWRIQMNLKVINAMLGESGTMHLSSVLYAMYFCVTTKQDFPTVTRLVGRSGTP